MKLKTASLTEPVLNILKKGHTEPPFTSQYEAINTPGTYLCRQCGLALFRTADQFISGCGWPSFDEIVQANVENRLDKDGMRTEILCKQCEAHLGHVFHGEGFTSKNKRYCVNGLSL